MDAKTAKSNGETEVLVELYGTVLDNTADGIIVIDEAATVEMFNAAASKLLGYHADEVVGKNINMLMPEPYAAEHDGYLKNYMTTGVAKILGIRREVEGLCKDGTVIPIDIGVREIYCGDRRLFVGVVRDLRDFRRAEEKIREQARSINEMSTPVIRIWSDILAMPLIGTLDSARTQRSMEAALTRMAEEKARVLIIDITGVPTVDTMVANHLIELAKAASLMGARSILTGISPVTSMTIVGLGIDLGTIETRSSLADGLKLAIALVGDGH